MSNHNRNEYDVIVIGAGPAGLSAALWCDELGLATLVLEKEAEAGGQLLWIHNEIRNHLGTEAPNGRVLRDRFLAQTAARGYTLRTGAAVEAVEAAAKTVTLADAGVFHARALVVATGIRRRRLGVAGEDEFLGRGQIASGKRHAGEAAGRAVVVVGGGDAAAENALILGERAARVTLVHRRAAFRARREFLDRIARDPKIRTLTESEVRAVSGGDRLESVEIEHLATGRRETLAADLLLVRIGVEPNTELFRGQLAMDAGGYIETNRTGATSVAGVFAVGDVANPLAPTVSGAVGDGATAAKTILAWLNP